MRSRLTISAFKLEKVGQGAVANRGGWREYLLCSIPLRDWIKHKCEPAHSRSGTQMTLKSFWIRSSKSGGKDAAKQGWNLKRFKNNTNIMSHTMKEQTSGLWCDVFRNAGIITTCPWLPGSITSQHHNYYTSVLHTCHLMSPACFRFLRLLFWTTFLLQSSDFCPSF